MQFERDLKAGTTTLNQERIIDSMKARLYTTEQMKQVVVMVVHNLLHQGQKAQANLDNERAQNNLSPYANLTCTVSEAVKI